MEEKKSAYLHNMTLNKKITLGIFDSGIGGLSLTIELIYKIQKNLKNTSFNIIYLADNDFLPYGDKSDKEITQRSEFLTTFLSSSFQLQTIFIACNTATVSSIHHLRKTFPHLSFVGVEPYVTFMENKEGRNENEEHLLLVTPRTKNSSRLHQLLRENDPHQKITALPLPELASLIEEYPLDWNSPLFLKKLGNQLSRVNVEKFESLIMGCTHYAFIQDALRSLYKKTVKFPSDSIIKQLISVLEKDKSEDKSDNQNSLTLINTANQKSYNAKMKSILDYYLPANFVRFNELVIPTKERP